MLTISYKIFIKVQKKKLKKLKSFLLCPKCGSGNYQIARAQLVQYTTDRYICNKCNYEGNFVKVDKDKIDEFRSNIKK